MSHYESTRAMIAVAVSTLALVLGHGVVNGQTLSRADSKPTAADVSYVQEPNTTAHPRQRLDVYAKEGLHGAPVAVYVHGGFWAAGDKENVRQLPAYFATSGIVFVSVGYRLVPEAKHPMQAQDVASAVAWVSANISRYGGDPKRVFLMGHSAGAHLVSLVGTDPRYLANAKAPPDALAGVIALDSAAMDLREIAANDRRADSPYRNAFGDDPATWADASPIVHAEVRPGERQPPFQLVVAYGPALENKKRGLDAFASALRSHKTRAEILEASAIRDHQSLMADFGAPEDPVSAAVVEFINAKRPADDTDLGGERVIEATPENADQAARRRAAYRVRVLTRQFDKDGDGTIIRGEMPDNPYLFDRMDRDGDGRLSDAELEAFDSARQDRPRPSTSPATQPSSYWTPSDTEIGQPGVSYRDPEFLQAGGLMTFADADGTVWVCRIDLKTGRPLIADGREFRIDGPISRWSRYSNGPEWGLDRSGPALFYMKDDELSAGQIWRAEPPWDAPRIAAVTSSPNVHHWLCGASTDAELPSIRLLTYVGQARGPENHTAWLDESTPADLHRVTRTMNLARWAFDSGLISWAPRVPGQERGVAQVTIVNTSDGTTRLITDDAGNKIDPWLWHAPEFGGETLLAVNVDRRALAIYRDTRRDGGPWTRIASLSLPADALHATLKSIEPVAGGRGAFGRSYFTVQAGDDADGDNSIWLFGFDPAGNHLIRRLDDSAQTGETGRRLDPESVIGSDSLFVYYTCLKRGRSELRLCETGVNSAEKR